ncbi:MAG: hypothetical protein BroJett011_43280 [Chloroflexota bacterium]|nr:MAG: hypothetical protein BroJett011_43280 [Chloroflexota bacterium]
MQSVVCGFPCFREIVPKYLDFSIEPLVNDYTLFQYLPVTNVYHCIVDLSRDLCGKGVYN